MPTLDTSTRDYILGISTVVTQAGGHPADADVMVANMLAEIDGKEADVVLDSRGGRCMENILPLFSVPRDVARLASGLAKAPHATLIDVYANSTSSRVVERLMKHTADFLAKQKQAPSKESADGDSKEEEGTEKGSEEEDAKAWALMWESMDAICTRLAAESWAEAACDANGCHAIRAMLALLGSAAAPPPSVIGIDTGAVCSLLLRMAAGLTAALCANVGYAAVNAHAGPTLAAALEALHTAAQAHRCLDEYHTLLVARLVDALASEHVLGSTAKNAVGSRLLEAVARVAPRSVVATLVSNSELTGDALVALARDKAANHVVQALLGAPGAAPEQIALLVKALLPHISELVGSNPGVVMQMAEACARCGVCETDLSAALQEALGGKKQQQKSSSNTNFAAVVLGSPQPQYLRSRLAQALLKMGKNVARAFAGSLAQQSESYLAQLACSKAGSHVVEAALKSSSIPVSMQCKLAAKLAGSAATLACNAQGSHVVELCYARADPALKETIAQELADREFELASDRHGRFVLQTCNIALFKGKKSVWQARVNSAQNTRELFRALLEDHDGTSASAPAAATATPAGADEKLELLPGGLDEFAQLLGVDEETRKRIGADAAKKKAKRKKPKKAPQAQATETAEPQAAPVGRDEEAKDDAADEALKQSVIDALKGTKTSKKKKDKKKKKKDKEGKKRARGEDDGDDDSAGGEEEGGSKEVKDKEEEQPPKAKKARRSHKSQ